MGGPQVSRARQRKNLATGRQTGVESLSPQEPFANQDGDAGAARLREVRNGRGSNRLARLFASASDDDPFVSSTAISALGAPELREETAALLGSNQPACRLSALLALRKAGVELDKEQLAELFHDQHQNVRRMALIWAGETMRIDLAEQVWHSLPLQAKSADLFEIFLATTQLLTEDELARVQRRTPGNHISRDFDQTALRKVITDSRLPAAAKAMAVRYVSEPFDTATIQLLGDLAESDDAALAVEAVRTLAAANDGAATSVLNAIAADGKKGTVLRCEAIMASAASEGFDPERWRPLLRDSDPSVALSAARALTARADDETVQRALKGELRADQHTTNRDSYFDQLHFALKSDVSERPQTDQDWLTTVMKGGDPAAGRRVFFSGRATCSTCHRIDGRGGRTGPDLSNIASSKTREEILKSLLDPSADTSPDYQGYLVLMDDGRSFRGTQFHFRGEAAEMLLEDGAKLRFQLDETEEYFALGESIMPDRLEENLSVSEVRDLVAFLSALRNSDSFQTVP